MKTGLDYAYGSKEKRIFDIAFGTALLPVTGLSHLALVHAFGRPYRSQIFRQTRVGELTGDERRVLSIYKLRTLHEQNEEVVPVSNLALGMRKNGLDESIQALNILRGEMSAVGPRPRIAEEDERIYDNIPSQLADKHRRIVQPVKRGILSSFSIMAHADEISQADIDLARVEMEIMDTMNASFTYDLKLLSRVMGQVAGKRMVVDGIRPRSHIETIRES